MRSLVGELQGSTARRPLRPLWRDYAAAQREVQVAQGEVSAAQPAADAAAARASSEAQAASNHTELVTFAERLAFVLVALAFGYWLLVRLRRSNSHYLTVAFACVGFATLLALVMAGDYLTDYLDVMQLGPVVLSLAGIALTLATFWWLQRYLARRVPPRRVRKGDCPSAATRCAAGSTAKAAAER